LSKANGTKGVAGRNFVRDDHQQKGSRLRSLVTLSREKAAMLREGAEAVENPAIGFVLLGQARRWDVLAEELEAAEAAAALYGSSPQPRSGKTSDARSRRRAPDCGHIEPSKGGTDGTPRRTHRPKPPRAVAARARPERGRRPVAGRI
jgi:hypothetical protein